MAFFGRNSLLLVLALVFVGSVAGPFSTMTFAQDDAAEEVIPYIADDEDEEEEEENAAPSIAADEPATDNGALAVAPGNTGAATSGSAAAEPTGLMKLLVDNLQVIGGILCALIMIPIFMKLSARQKKKSAPQFAAANAGAQATDLPISPPVDPLVIDEHQAFTDDGMVSPIEDLRADGISPEINEVVEQYAGSDVPPGAPNYPSIPNAPTTIIEDKDSTTAANSIAADADFPYAGLKSDGANESAPSKDDAVDIFGDGIEAVELDDEPVADVESIFEVEPSEPVAIESTTDSKDADIDEFEAANASDPFEVEDETNEIDELKLVADDVDDVKLAAEDVGPADDEELAAKIVTEEFADAATDEAVPPKDIPVVAAGAAAAAATVAADTGIAEMRVAAIQEALSTEQQRVAKLNAEREKLKNTVSQLEEQLAAAKKSSVSSAAGSDQLSDFDISAVVNLQEENRKLSAQLTEEIAKRQANDSQLKTLETSVQSLDARLSLVNTERDNLARMLYDAKQQAAAALRKPR